MIPSTVIDTHNIARTRQLASITSRAVKAEPSAKSPSATMGQNELTQAAPPAQDDSTAARTNSIRSARRTPPRIRKNSASAPKIEVSTRGGVSGGMGLLLLRRGLRLRRVLTEDPGAKNLDLHARRDLELGDALVHLQKLSDEPTLGDHAVALGETGEQRLL